MVQYSCETRLCGNILVINYNFFAVEGSLKYFNDMTQDQRAMWRVSQISTNEAENGGCRHEGAYRLT
jgi:hypothetical protein